MALTISFSKGRLAPLHDMRIGKLPENVDPNLLHNNVTFIDKLGEFNYSIECYTNAKFQPHIDAYNATQTRGDRKKTKPYVEILKEENEKLIRKAEENKKMGKKTAVRKPTPIAIEYVMQFGNRDTNGTINPKTDMEQNKYAACRFLEEFQKRYPHMDILLATFHGDEPGGTPHLHITIQPTGEGYKQGLAQQISISKALECDGFERKNVRGDYAIERWLNDVKDEIMENVLQEVFGEEREIIGEHRQHLPTDIFRQKAQKEAKALTEARNEYESFVISQDQRLIRIHDKLAEHRDELKEMQSTLEVEKANFDDYKTSEIKTLQDKNVSLEQKERQLNNFASRASEMFCDAKDFVDRAKKLYNALDTETKALYRNSLVELDESLLSYQPQRKRTRSL